MQKLLSVKGARKPVWLIFLLIGFLFLQACQAGPEVLSAPIMGYNHTSAAINEFTVNGAGGQIWALIRAEVGKYVVA